MARLFGSGDDAGIDEALVKRSEKQALFHRYPRGWPIGLFFMIMLGTLASVMALERADRQTRQAELDRNLTEVASALQRRAAENIALLRAGAALFGSREAISAREFADFAAGVYTDGDSHGARGMGWARMLRPYEVPAFVAEQRRVRPDFHLHPDAGRQRYVVPVTYLSLETPAMRTIVGTDMYADAARREAMTRALRSRQPTATSPVRLYQDLDRPTVSGFVIYVPVFRMESGRRVPRGFVYSPFRADEFLRSAGELLRNHDVAIALYDRADGRARLLARRTVPGDDGVSLTRPLTIGGREWLLQVRDPQAHWLTPLSRVTLLFGLIIGLLAMYTARLVTKRAAEDRQVLEWLSRQAAIRTSLTRELNHRVKNTLANVLSIVSLTRRRANGLDDFADSLTARVRALSATHDLLSQSDWTTAPIGEIVRSELAPYMTDGERHVSISGPEVSLAPNDALSLGLAIHELATNAAKYGALSVPEGRIAITWRPIEDGADPLRVEVHWREEGGPAVAPPRRRGFGRDLIERIVAHELRSEVALDFRPEGVECRLQVPVRRTGEFTLRQTPVHGSGQGSGPPSQIAGQVAGQVARQTGAEAA